METAIISIGFLSSKSVLRGIINYQAITCEMPSTDILTNLKFLPPPKIKFWIREDKIFERLEIKFLKQMFNVSNNQRYNLRSNQIPQSLERPKTNFIERTFPYRGATSWNNLDEHFLSQRRARRKTYSYYKDQCPT